LIIAFNTTNLNLTGNAIGKNPGVGESFLKKVIDFFETRFSPPKDLKKSLDDLKKSEGIGEDNPPGTCTSITQYGITWNFQNPTTCGKFVNGDWWIVSPVKVVSKNPPQTANPGRNGDWINPTFNDALGQPYDDRIGGQFFGTPYSASLRPSYPIEFNLSTYPQGASFLSTISHPQTTQSCFQAFADTGTNFNQQCNRGPIKSAAILTILNQIPPIDSFRPAYNGDDKTIKFTKSNLDYSKLGSLTPAGSIMTYSLSDVNRHIQRPYVQTRMWANEVETPSDNHNGYGQFMAADISLAALILNLNSYTNAQKEPIMISLVQVGIDFYGVYRNGIYFDTGRYQGPKNRAAWYGLGGHGQGRMFPILFAGTVLNNLEMKNVGFDAPNDYHFSELAQTFTVTDYTGVTPQPGGYIATKDMLVHSNYCSTGGINCNQGGYSVADIGLPEFGFAHYHENDADVRSWTGNNYRRCCTANAWGGYLLASHAMGIADLWNSQVLFDYMDRYMRGTAPGGAAQIAQGEEWHRGWMPPLFEMWDAERDNYGCTWVQDNPTNIYSQGHYDCAGNQVRCPGMATTTGSLVTTCNSYLDQRTFDYDPCNFGCTGTFCGVNNLDCTY
jgi:hypothetical protein